MYVRTHIGVHEMVIMCVHTYIQYMHIMNITHLIDTVRTYVPLAHTYRFVCRVPHLCTKPVMWVMRCWCTNLFSI